VLQAVASQTEQAGNRPDDVADLLQRLNPRTNGYGEARRTVNFVGCHDYKRPMTLIASEGGFSKEAAIRRMRLVTALLLTSPGLPMVWMGCEFGMPGERTLDQTPVDWNLLAHSEHVALRDLHRALIALRQRHAALACGEFEPVLCDTERQLIAYRRWTPDMSLALVVAHLRDDRSVEVSLENTGLLDGPWTDVISGATCVAVDGRFALTLGPSGFAVLVREPEPSCTGHPSVASAGAGLPPDAEHS
jgi:1,4-alpha-glucan branching enzyme